MEFQFTTIVRTDDTGRKYIKMPEIKQHHATSAVIRSRSDLAFRIDLKKALKKSPVKWLRKGTVVYVDDPGLGMSFDSVGFMANVTYCIS